MELIKIFDLICVFSLGFFTACLIFLYFVSGYEVPYVPLFGVMNLGNASKTPSDFVNEKEIIITDDKIVINVLGASLGRYTPSGSMEPILNENSNGIRVVPYSEDEISVGDIITFKDKDVLIVHRVIDKGKDDNGVYFITKGDNNLINDGKVRFEDIEYKTVGVIW